MEAKEGSVKIKSLDSNSPKIYKPKPKKLCISYNLLKPSFRKYKKNNKNYPLMPISKKNVNFNKEIIDNYNNNNEYKVEAKNHKYDFDEISLEEIESDFTKLKAKREAYKVKKELLYLLRNSNSKKSLNNEDKEKLKIKRPKNPFFEGLA